MIDGQLKKGVLDMCLLKILESGEMYGYAILKTVKRHFPESFDGTVYTALRRMAADGLLSVCEGASEVGPTRKYYKITEAGRGKLADFSEGRRKLNAITAEPEI